MREAIERFCAEYAAERKDENRELIGVLKKYIAEEENNLSHEERQWIFAETKEVRHDQMFAVTGDPWAQSPGDDKAGIIQA